MQTELRGDTGVIMINSISEHKAILKIVRQNRIDFAEKLYAFATFMSLIWQYCTVIYYPVLRSPVSSLVTVADLFVWAISWIYLTIEKKDLRKQIKVVLPAFVLFALLAVKLALANGYSNDYLSPSRSIYQIYSLIYALFWGLAMRLLSSQIKRKLLFYFYIALMNSKILHYCWFGNSPLPLSTTKYMESWKRFLPDFEFMRWDETNFDVDSVPFVKAAYESKMWAFVSDYVRCYALYNYGGLYVDTDVEFVKRIEDLIDTSFVGFENPEYVNPGLILYALCPKLTFYKELLDKYDNIEFDENNAGRIISPIIFTDLLKNIGLKQNNTLQQIGEIKVYPMEYFQPLGDKRYKIKKCFTENTRTIHHYDATWLDNIEKELYQMKKKYGNFWGKCFFSIKHPMSAYKKLKNK